LKHWRQAVSCAPRAVRSWHDNLGKSLTSSLDKRAQLATYNSGIRLSPLGDYTLYGARMAWRAYRAVVKARQLFAASLPFRAMLPTSDRGTKTKQHLVRVNYAAL